jgi:hypothetical protein
MGRDGLGGSRVEYTRDGWRESLMVPEIPKTCTDCIVMNYSTERLFGSRDLFFNAEPEVRRADRHAKRLGIQCC